MSSAEHCKRPNLQAWLSNFDNSDQYSEQPFWPDYSRWESSYFMLPYTFGVLDENCLNAQRNATKSGSARLELLFDSTSNGNLRIFLVQRYSVTLGLDSYCQPVCDFIL